MALQRDESMFLKIPKELSEVHQVVNSRRAGHYNVVQTNECDWDQPPKRLHGGITAVQENVQIRKPHTFIGAQRRQHVMAKLFHSFHDGQARTFGAGAARGRRTFQPMAELVAVAWRGMWTADPGAIPTLFTQSSEHEIAQNAGQFWGNFCWNYLDCQTEECDSLFQTHPHCCSIQWLIPLHPTLFIALDLRLGFFGSVYMPRCLILHTAEQESDWNTWIQWFRWVNILGSTYVWLVSL